MHKKYDDTIMVLAICNSFNVSDYFLGYTALPIFYPKYNINYSANDLVMSEAKRISIMMKNEFADKCSNIPNIKEFLSTLSLVYINKRYYLSNCDDKVYEIFKTFGYEVKKYDKN